MYIERLRTGRIQQVHMYVCMRVYVNPQFVCGTYVYCVLPYESLENKAAVVTIATRIQQSLDLYVHLHVCHTVFLRFNINGCFSRSGVLIKQL